MCKCKYIVIQSAWFRYLVLDRLTGCILHIDFGDSFEVAMRREKFLEKIPFHLTCILTVVMEVRRRVYREGEEGEGRGRKKRGGKSVHVWSMYV